MCVCVCLCTYVRVCVRVYLHISYFLTGRYACHVGDVSFPVFSLSRKAASTDCSLHAHPVPFGTRCRKFMTQLNAPSSNHHLGGIFLLSLTSSFCTVPLTLNEKPYALSQRSSPVSCFAVHQRVLGPRLCLLFFLLFFFKCC